MYCTNCGAKAESSFRFCAACGSPLSAVPAPAPAEPELVFELPPEVLNTAPQAADRSAVLADTQQSPVSSPKSTSYFLRHWRGETSLAFAFWVNGFVVNLIVLAIVGILQKSEAYTSASPLIAGGSMLATMLIYPLAIWQLVGTFRAANNTTARGEGRFWPTVVIILIIFNSLMLIAEFADTGATILRTGFTLITGDSDFPEARFKLMNNGTELEMSGGIPAGTAIEFKRQLDAAPDVQLIHLNSSAGRMADADKISKLIEAKGLSTYTERSCESACAYIFLSGKQRLLGQKARLGFHSPSIDGRETFGGMDMADGFREKMKAKGVGTAFTEKALTTKSDDMWYPEQTYLKSSGVVTAIVDPDKFASSSYMGWRSTEDFDAKMIEFPYLKALREFDPERYEKFVAPMRKGFSDGKPMGDIVADIRTVAVNDILPYYLPRASDQALTAYWSTQIDEFEYLLAHHPQACANMMLPHLAKDTADATELVPESMLKADLNALATVIKTGAGRAIPIPEDSKQSESDFEVVGQIMMGKSPESIEVVSDPEKHFSQPAKLCRGFVDFFNAINTLPLKRQANAYRAVFNAGRESKNEADEAI